MLAHQFVSMQDRSGSGATEHGARLPVTLCCDPCGENLTCSTERQREGRDPYLAINTEREGVKKKTERRKKKRRTTKVKKICSTELYSEKED